MNVTEVRHVKAVDNPANWGMLADFICTHREQRQCARPVFILATNAWWEGAVNKIGDRTTLPGKLQTALYRWFPIFFGAKVVVCVSCQSVVFLNKFNGFLYQLVTILRTTINPDGDAPLRFLMFSGDVDMIPEPQAKQIHLEDVEGS